MELTTNPKARLSSVANAIRLVKAFSDNEYEIGISSLAQRLGLAKSTVHRLATTLIEAGMLEQNPETGKYRLGLMVFELGALVRRKMDVYNEAKPWLYALRDQTGETVHLAVPARQGIVYINFMESQKAIRMSSGIGQRKPLHCTAEGKAILAFQAPEIVERIIAAGLEQFTPKTITDIGALRDELAVVRARGYAVDDEEYELGMRCLAAPVRDDSGNLAAAVGIAGPVQRLTKKMLLSHAPTLVNAVAAISQRLGDHGNDRAVVRAPQHSPRRHTA
jgi:IclR family transcriptional regulator, KDG regulon repressor